MTEVQVRPTETRPESGGVSFMQATWLVAEREIKAFLQTKGFWIGLGAIIVGLFAASILPGVIGGGPTQVAAVGPEVSRVLQASEFEVREASDAAQAEDLVRSEEVEAAVVPDTTGESPAGVRVVALESPRAT
ncbi:hypothetical protein [Saccharomonospora sp. CUA-673]|uniref:hypothetical protein n=1 Tax=Saccharomonospora sp. CUA-673 TaxID=1904969 RepID=UPI003519C29B